MSVLVVGSYNQDHVWRIDRFPQPGETRRGLGFSTGPGGKGFNQAVASARQGVPTAFIGALGGDALARTARELAQADGIATRWQVCDDMSTGSCGIVVDANGQNQIVLDLAANERLDAAYVAAQTDLFASARVVLVQMETGLGAIRAALSSANAGCVRLLNPAPVHAELDAGLLALADLVTPNETEFAALLDRCAGTALRAEAIADCRDDELHALCRRLGALSVIVTLGARGCFVSHADPARWHDASPGYRVAAERVHVRDTTGAGDAFNGALAAELAQRPGRALREAVVHAGRVAALSTETAGAAVAMPTRAAVLQRFGL
ncbi:MAG TPA: ribokinase [Tahibacter sp.]|uniref:ribokinase n=1 Tax=Tahibacter sp. TaxID=2056211 RepID=UPI002BAC7910|nr:ribokinase [Tahibacter sp.]HSX59190.1 ribokinase [Tahibacter sp.]